MPRQSTMDLIHQTMVEDLKKWATGKFINEHNTNKFLPKQELYEEYCLYCGGDGHHLLLGSFIHELTKWCKSMNLSLNPNGLKGLIKPSASKRVILLLNDEFLEVVYIHDNSIGDLPAIHAEQ